MNESSKGYDPHAGIIIIDADSVIYTDNSSGNVNKGVSRRGIIVCKPFKATMDIAIFTIRR